MKVLPQRACESLLRGMNNLSNKAGWTHTLSHTDKFVGCNGVRIGISPGATRKHTTQDEKEPNTLTRTYTQRAQTNPKLWGLES